MPPTLGFTNEVAKAQEARSLRQFKEQLKSQERIEKIKIKQQGLVEKEKYRLQKYRLKELAKAKKSNSVKSFMKYNKGIASSKIIPRYNQPVVNQPLPQQQQNPSFNPFAHRSEMEVYGDEGLTLFDGDKRGDDDTGGLFGISRRRFR